VNDKSVGRMTKSVKQKENKNEKVGISPFTAFTLHNFAEG